MKVIAQCFYFSLFCSFILFNYIPHDRPIFLRYCFFDRFFKTRFGSIPDYAFDVHTGKGVQRGKTKRDFILDEHDALQPKGRTLFDQDVEAVRRGERQVIEKKRGIR